jgi:hypothetical protein
MSKHSVAFLPFASLAQDILLPTTCETLLGLGEVHWRNRGRNLIHDEVIERLHGVDAPVKPCGSPAPDADLLASVLTRREAYVGGGAQQWHSAYPTDVSPRGGDAS